jgi:hypothetical protein
MSVLCGEDKKRSSGLRQCNKPDDPDLLCEFPFLTARFSIAAVAVSRAAKVFGVLVFLFVYVFAAGILGACLCRALLVADAFFGRCVLLAV